MLEFQIQAFALWCLKQLAFLITEGASHSILQGSTLPFAPQAFEFGEHVFHERHPAVAQVKSQSDLGYLMSVLVEW